MTFIQAFKNLQNALPKDLLPPVIVSSLVCPAAPVIKPQIATLPCFYPLLPNINFKAEANMDDTEALLETLNATILYISSLQALL